MDNLEPDVSAVKITVATSRSRPMHPLCLFHCGPLAFAIGLESVAEVVEVERLVRFPYGPPRVLGLVALRREVIPVIALNDVVADPFQPRLLGGLLVLILKTARGLWAIRINTEGTVVSEESIDAPSPSTPKSEGPSFLGTVQRGETCYNVIDPEATWKHVRTSVEDWYRDRLGRDTAETSEPAIPANRAG